MADREVEDALAHSFLARLTELRGGGSLVVSGPEDRAASQEKRFRR
jgi:hypothetical protein